MSMFVKDGQAITYVVVNPVTQTVLSTHNWINQAHKAKENSERSCGVTLAVHNITHSKCPDWLKEMILSDSGYCQERARVAEKGTAGLRKRADDLIAQADAYDRQANEWLAQANAAEANEADEADEADNTISSPGL